jgi:peptidoglycan/LPS O-acetylase OafA/YrhL
MWDVRLYVSALAKVTMATSRRYWPTLPPPSLVVGYLACHPTRQVVAGFEPTAVDNHRIIVQEWLTEAFTMWGLAALVIAVTAGAGDENVTTWVYRIVAVLLAALAVLTALTGARTRVFWFKVCPVLLTTTAVLSSSRASSDKTPTAARDRQGSPDQHDQTARGACRGGRGRPRMRADRSRSRVPKVPA